MSAHSKAKDDPSPQGPDGGRVPPLAVLVAGGTGFLGAAFVRTLHDAGHRVAVLSRDAGKVADRFPGRSVEAREGDVRRPEDLRGAFDGIEVVVQAVQFPGFPVEDPSRGRTFMEVDARGTTHVAEAAAGADVRRLIYLSGVGADGSSPRPWYRAKGVAEAAVRAHAPEHVCIRPSWVYGPEDQSLNRFADLIRWVPLAFPQLGPGDQRLNPVFVGDVAEAVAASVERPDLRRATYELGGPVTYTMDEIVRVVMDALGRRKPIIHVPASLARGGAGLLEALPGQLLSRGAVEFLTQDAVADVEAFRQLFPAQRLTPMPEALRAYLSRSGATPDAAG